jgi:hypothetical protein
MLRLLLLSACLAAPVFAQEGEPAATVSGPDLRDLMHARNIGMGGAYLSMGYGAETVTGNPAALAAYKRYQIEGSGLWDVPNGMGMGTLALADSTNPLAAGISYQFATFGGLERRWAHITTLALSYALGDWIFLGLSGRHHIIVGATNTNSITMNAGLLIRPVQFLSIGISGHNLIYNFNPDISRYFAASVSALLFNQLTPAFDVRADFNGPAPRFAYHGGLEWLIAMTVPIRAGYQYDGIQNHHYVSGGIGWFSEGSGVDLAYRHEIGGAQGKLLALTLKLQLGQ